MRILIAHNFYQQAGGEDVVFAAERDLLRAHGHEVETLTEHNDRIVTMSPVRLAGDTIWSRTSYRAARAAIRRSKAEVVHVHNTFPLLSPALYDAARSEGVPVVQTLHNWRLLCPAASLYRQGAVCRECLDTAVPWPAVRYGCYQGSRLRSLGVATMLTVHRLRQTWARSVARYIVMSEFARTLFATHGIPEAKLVLKPHFVSPDPGVGSGDGGYALFVGRLAEGKGIDTLCRAWRRLDDVPLKIVGDGPLDERVRTVVGTLPHVELLPRQSRAEVQALMRRAAFVVFPSELIETFGLVVAEAFAHGTPVVASTVGAPSEFVEEGVNGVTFEAGDASSLELAVRRIVSTSAIDGSMREAARQTYLTRFTAEVNYRELLAVYRSVVNDDNDDREQEA